MFRPGTELTESSRVVELRGSDDEVVVLFRTDPNPNLFGLPIPLTDLTTTYFYNSPISSPDEWLDELGTEVMVQLDTGYVSSASRVLIDDYIELREPRWPFDERFFVDVVPPDIDDSWLRVPFVADDGLDPAPALELRERGLLIAWITAYENNSTGSPYVGTATVSWIDDTVAELAHIQTVEDLPETAVLDIAHAAVHAAADLGATTVTTAEPYGDLDLLGFKQNSDSSARIVDTRILDADVERATESVETALKEPSQWGQDRDREGRHIPPGHIARLIHRLRHGTGRKAGRTYAG